MGEQFAVRGRVLSVSPLVGGRFRVLLGPPPNMFSFIVDRRPPKVGERLTLRGRLLSTDQVKAGELVGSLGTLDVTSWLVDVEDYPTRVVASVWHERVTSVMRRPLYRYQVEGAAWLASRLAQQQGALLYDDPGLGKSAQTVAALCAARAFPAIVVCPGSLKLQWAREFGWASDPPIVNVVQGRCGELPPANVHVLNYELLRAREPQLYQLGAKALVFDEIQAVKEPEAGERHRATVATRITLRVKPVIGLSGTPMLNRPQELWRQLHIVDPVGWPTFGQFKRLYCGGRRGKNEPETLLSPVGRAVETSAGRVQRIDELHAKAGSIMLRRLKSQVLKDLPAKSRHSLLVELSPEYLAYYRRAERDVVAWLRSMGYGGKAQRAERAQAVVKMTYLRHLAALAKLESAVPEYLARWFDRQGLEPLVIFGYHADVMRGLLSICQNLGLRTTGIGGGESIAKKQAAVDRFIQGEADVFLAPILVAGVGLNLQRASDALFVERTFVPNQLTQAEDRIHRIGSERPVTITYLDAAHTVDEHMADVLSAKMALIRATLDEQRAEAVTSVATADAVADRLVASGNSS